MEAFTVSDDTIERAIVVATMRAALGQSAGEIGAGLNLIGGDLFLTVKAAEIFGDLQVTGGATPPTTRDLSVRVYWVVRPASRAGRWCVWRLEGSLWDAGEKWGTRTYTLEEARAEVRSAAARWSETFPNAARHEAVV